MNMKYTISIALFLVAILVSYKAKAQFEVGQSFISGGFSFSASDLKLDENQSAQNAFGYNINSTWGTFTKENKAKGWGINHSLSSRIINGYDIAPRSFQGATIGIERFAEYYSKPIFEKLVLYIRPRIGLTYALNNTLTNENAKLTSETQNHTLTLGAGISAGIAWRLTPRWALYGSFAFTNPISLTGGISNTVNYQQKNPQGENLKIRGNFFEYNFSPTLSSGGISLGFRYFYTRKNSDS